MTSSSPPVGIFVGSNVDDSAGPPTYERNRYVADLVLNYACYPFMPGPDCVLATSALIRPAQAPSPSPSSNGTVRGEGSDALFTSPVVPTVPQSSDGRPLHSPKAYTATSLSIWTPDATTRLSSSTHLWYADPFPPVGVEEMAAFHDEAYLRYLCVRETLSEVDEFSSVVKRRRAESRQPTSSTGSHRSSIIAAITGDPVAARAIAAEPHPLRLLPDLEAIKSDDEYGLNHDASPFLGMWKTIQATVSGTLTAVRWLTEEDTAEHAHHQRDDGGASVNSAARVALSTGPAATGGVKSSASPHPDTSSAANGVPSRDVGDGGRGCARRVAPLDAESLDAPFAAHTPISTLDIASPSRSSMLHRTIRASCLQRPRPTLGSRWAALHWFGGRHHAQRDSASGFCYVNDVVLAAMALHARLPKSRNKVLIIDLDAHHGDGTQAAFLYDPNYYVLSVHGYGAGLFPHSGAASEVGKGSGKGYTANVTLPEGATDRLLVPLARQAVKAALHTMGDAVGAIVLVCGADGLQGDEVGKLNYTIAGMQCVTRYVIERAIERECKLLVLGAGGYVDTSTARLSSVVTRDVLSAAAAVQQCSRASPDQLVSCHLDLFFASPALTNLGVPVPDSCTYFTHYGPSFLMHGLPGAKYAKVDHLETSQPYYTTLCQMRERGTNSRRTSVGSTV